jgi:hypothetical protein
MFSFPLLRKRIPSEPISGGNTRIQAGLFGTGAPTPGIALDFDPARSENAASIYSYHPGDIFTPGAESWVFEPNFELPLQTIWGNAFLRRANTFNPRQAPQIWAQPNVVNNGLGGLTAGEMELQGLINPENQNSGFVGDFAE